VRLAIIIGIFTGILTLLIFAEHLIDDSEEPSYLFVLSVTSGSLKGDTLILNGVPNVIYFSDHMSRKVGHMSLSNFVEKWDKGVDSFKADPPNATLSVLMKNGERNVEVELLSAEYKNGWRLKVMPLIHSKRHQCSFTFIRIQLFSTGCSDLPS